jgi:putative ABC transport system permease protein
MGESLLKQQLTSSEQTDVASNGAMAGQTRGVFRQSASTAVQIDEIDVSAGISEYLVLFGAGYLILILAMILPSINILRYQPKTILTGKE